MRIAGTRQSSIVNRQLSWARGLAGRRLPCTEEIAGSNPAGSTTHAHRAPPAYRPVPALVLYGRERGDDAGMPLFPSLRTGVDPTTEGLLVFGSKLGIRAGVPPCSPHSFRRAFATSALDAEMDLDTRCRLMGHAKRLRFA
jgi:integrase